MGAINLDNWCSACDLRDFCRSPWRAGGFVYATNGHRAIRMVDDGRDLPETPARAPTAYIDAILAEPVDGPTFRLPPLPETRYAACSQCDGVGSVIDLVRVCGHVFQLHYLNDLPQNAICGLLAPRKVLSGSGTHFAAQPFVARGDGWAATVLGVRADDYDLVYDINVEIVA